MSGDPTPEDCVPFAVRHDRFRGSLGPSDWEEFAGLPDDGRRIRFVYSRLYARNACADRSSGSKDGDGALGMKNAGTQCFQRSEYWNALNWYSLATLHCPQTEDWLVQLSIIYANRSACLYQLKNYDLAVLEVQRALDNGYPEDLRYKVYERKARCFLAMKQFKSALKSFKDTMLALDYSNLSPDKRRQRQMDVQMMLTMMAEDKNIGNDLLTGARAAARKLPEVHGGRNHAYPVASDAVSIGYNETEGRHATAGRDIPVGRVLLVERAHASVLLREYCHSHCTNCFAKLVAPLPCPDCSRVAFCDDTCKNIALKSYHAIECSILPMLYTANVSITCLIALRIITQRPFKYFINLRPKLNHTESLRGKREPDDDYVDLYNLVAHRQTRSAQDMLHRTHMAAFYLRCLRDTNYFGDDRDDDRHLFIGGLLLHHLLLLQFNAFEVSKVRRRGSDDQQTVFIGGSVYPTLALLNHSCDPSVVRYHQGTTVIVCNIRDLCAGEAITENYGPLFMFQPKEERQQTLKTRYWFECNCIACCQDWPTWEQMKNKTSLRIRCINCKNAITVTTDSMELAVNCKVCSKKTNMLAVLKVLQDTDNKYTIAKQLMNKHDYEKALPKLMVLLSLLHKHLVPPFKDYHLCQQAIRECMLSFGNKL